MIFYKCLNKSWKLILWVLPLSHKLPKQQHGSKIINTKIHWSKEEKNEQIQQIQYSTLVNK